MSFVSVVSTLSFTVLCLILYSISVRRFQNLDPLDREDNSHEESVQDDLLASLNQTISDSFMEMNAGYLQVSRRLETHKMKAQILNHELRARIEELEAMVLAQRHHTQQAMEVQNELMNRIERLEIRQQELSDQAEAAREEMLHFHQDFFEKASRTFYRSNELARSMVEIQDAYADHGSLANVQLELDTVRQKFLEIGETIDELSRKQDEKERLLQRVQEVDRTARKIASAARRVHSTKKCPKVTPVKEMSLATYDAVLSKSLSEERERLNLLTKAIVCPLNPLSELCFSDIQRHVHRLIDYAQRSAGTKVVSARTSPTFRYAEASSPFLSLVMNVADMLRLSTDGNVGPEIALSRDNSLGNCWPMAGHIGNLTIQLHTSIHIHSISIDHISRYS